MQENWCEELELNKVRQVSPSENGTFPDSVVRWKNWIEKCYRIYQGHIPALSSKSCSNVLTGKCGYDRTILQLTRTFNELCAMGKNK